MNMDTRCTEIEVIFKKEYPKMEHSNLLHVGGSVVSAFQPIVYHFQYKAYYETFLLDCSNLSYIFQRSKTN
jgi:hypothetical protein